MLKQFEQHIINKNLFTKQDSILIAFSGGVDSVVLTDLLHKNGYLFSIVHCNFKLRGAEANHDTDFCEQYAQSIDVPFYVTYFDTKHYADTNNLSIQMAARELRYNWFKELITTHGFKYVLTAHHANDNIETLLVNLTRGTGIKGLQGIPEKKEHIIRPLLFATKQEIIQYSQNNNLAYREDSSNVEIKYKRNFIRHQIIPQFKILNPTIEQTIISSMQFFKQSSDIVSAFAQLKFNEICQQTSSSLKINTQLLLQEPQKETLLFEWLSPKQFKTIQIQQLTQVLLLPKPVGKQFISLSHKLVIDRHFIFVEPISHIKTATTFIIKDINDISHLPIRLSFHKTTDVAFTTDTNEILVPYSDNLFPLTLRKWKNGDKFKPFGMNGFKKLSDYFKDKKLSLFDKEAVWILENKQHILWIVGYRMDNRCKVDSTTNEVIKIKIDSSKS